MENANNSRIESHRSSTILSQSDGTHCDTPNAILDVPHPLQRQRYHLLDRDPQWHNVFLSANSHQSSMATKGKGAAVPKKIPFLPRNKVTTHLQSCWWSLPENAGHLQHKDTRNNGLSATQKFTNPYFWANYNNSLT